MNTTGQESEQIEELNRQLGEWRQNRKKRRRLPEVLWKGAAELAEKYGINKVARVCHLDYYKLKERCEGTGKSSNMQLQSKPPFIEVIPTTAPVCNECEIEFERSNGSKMRIHIKGGSLPDLANLTAAFWKQGQ